MKKRIALISIFSSFVLLTGLTACRHGHHHGGIDEFDLEAASKRIAYRLDLSESQKTQLQAIMTEIANEAKQMRADRETRHRELADLVRRESIEPEAVDRIIAEKFDQMQALADLAADRLIGFHATLTPEQREKVAGHIEEHAARHQARFQP
jgi:Spy/CpxP family protein refolding chaperone